MLEGILSELDETMANGTNPQKKHLLRRVVKKVLIHDRRTIEVWYCLPNKASVRTADYLAPQQGHTTNVSSATHPGHPEITQDDSRTLQGRKSWYLRLYEPISPPGPEVLFRIVHSAVPGQIGTPPGTYGEQEVAVAFGPVGIADDGRIGILTRRVVANQTVRVIPLTRKNLMQLGGSKIPRVTELLRMAVEWRRQLDAGEVQNRADIARREGITRVRVTQVLGLLRLAPEIQEKILALPPSLHRHLITERMLRPM